MGLANIAKDNQQGNMSDETKENIKEFVKDWLPVVVLAIGVVGSYATLTARHEDAMRRIAEIEKIVAEDHDTVVSIVKDIEYIKHGIDEIKDELKERRQ